MVRKPAVAGKFYPISPDAINKQMKEFEVEVKQKVDCMGVVSPHAGYVYSGGVAGAVYSNINIPEDVIIIGPNHTGLGEMVSLMASGEWEMPNGIVKINADLANDIISSSRYIKDDSLGHLHEHSLEVQIPFIQYFKKNFKIVPITIMTLDYELCEDIGAALSAAIKNFNKPVLIVASTDMTHYESQKSANIKDKKAIDEILKLDPKGLFETVVNKNISMCGIAPTTAMLIACNNLGAREARLVKYMTSGDVSGDYEQVVGYAGLIIR
ncbi:MAG: AmmeMemoRadiSam system protein B [Nitrospinae bacterium RIFCSPLOWO2_01_FULL_39_10]|nr:MAG: AmmeMemoRadiSam system protein B [Nitrospinae bacterium RIFCSPLOWO2_01_FULL_39_10]